MPEPSVIARHSRYQFTTWEHIAITVEGKVAVISGGASLRGIGRATAALLAAHGARIVILDVDGDGARESAVSIGSEHIGIECDVASSEQCVGSIETALEAFGKIDILINNAGVASPHRIADIDAAAWDRVHDINLRGALNLSQATIPHMRSRKQGSIICMSSIAAQRGGGIFGGAHYAAAKAGVLGLAKAMARELGPDGIRVNCVTPGLIQTDITGDHLTAEQESEIASQIPLGRLGETGDVAGVVLFLASDLSSYLTGNVIDVNGGMLIHG